MHAHVSSTSRSMVLLLEVSTKRALSSTACTACPTEMFEQLLANTKLQKCSSFQLPDKCPSTQAQAKQALSECNQAALRRSVLHTRKACTCSCASK